MGDRLLKYRPGAYHHVVFATKCRKPILVGPVADCVRKWLGQIADQYGFQVMECNFWLDHVHMLIFVRPGEDLCEVMEILKGGSARKVFQDLEELRLQIHENHLWGRSFYAGEVPAAALDDVRRYIRNQPEIHSDRASQLPISAWERWRDLVE